MKALRDSVSKKKDYTLADMELAKSNFRKKKCKDTEIFDGLFYYENEDGIITFEKDHSVGIFCTTEDEYMCLNVRELKAINEKCKELGWLDE